MYLESTVQNYIKTNILSLGQHFVLFFFLFFFAVEVESVKNSNLENWGKKELKKKKKEKKSKPGIKFTFRSAVYVTLISSLFSDEAFRGLCCCNPSVLSYKNTIFSCLIAV